MNCPVLLWAATLRTKRGSAAWRAASPARNHITTSANQPECQPGVLVLVGAGQHQSEGLLFTAIQKGCTSVMLRSHRELIFHERSSQNEIWCPATALGTAGKSVALGVKAA